MLPAVLKNISLLGGANSAVKSAGIKSGAVTADLKTLDNVYADIKAGVNHLEKAIDVCEAQATELKKAKAYASKGVAALDKLRADVDTAEELVADELWPMAKYQELLLVL